MRAAQVTLTPNGIVPAGAVPKAATSTVLATVLATSVDPTSAGRKLKMAA